MHLGLKEVLQVFIFIFGITSCNKDKNIPDDTKDSESIIPVAPGNYRNPLEVENQYELIGKEGVADPSIFRWKGRYYLLSTQYYDENIGFIMWESKNLVNWKYKSSIKVKNFQWNVLWSPEMYYYRGTFYIYISGPNGKMAVWKYTLPLILSSEDPFGDDSSWQVITHDFFKLPDHSIDGSILIEPNGDKFAFFSGMNGVKYRKINSMEDGTGEPIVHLTQCVVNNIPKDNYVGDPGWTEAPTVFKKDGKYYLTYTGNHYLRPDYQIHLAVGNSINNFKPILNNPWISNIYGEWTATGNCYPILGPNLVDYYYSYHTKEGGRVSHATEIHRKLMLDKVKFVDDIIETHAPTYSDQTIPAGPAYENDFSNGLDGFTIVGNPNTEQTSFNALSIGVNEESSIYTEEKTEDNFVAEIYFKIVDTLNEVASRVSFIHGNDIVGNNIEVGIEIENGISYLVILEKVKGKKTIELPDNFNSLQLVDMRIEKKMELLRVYVNNIQVISMKIGKFKSSNVGVKVINSKVEVSWLAFN